MHFPLMLLLFIHYLEGITILKSPAQTNESLSAIKSIYPSLSSRHSVIHGEDEPLDLETLIQIADENQPRTLPLEITNYIYQAHPRKKIDKNTVQMIYNLLQPEWNKWDTSEKIECPPTYERVGQNCLSLTCPMESCGWKEARLYCRVIKGGDLAVFNSNEELEAAIHFLKKTDKNRQCSYWIGGSDIDSEDDWKWNDGRVMPYGSPPWGQINGKVEPGGGKYENFAMLYNKDNYLIHDISTEGARNFPLVPLCQLVTSDYYGKSGKNSNLLLQKGNNSQTSIPYKDFIDFLLNEPKHKHENFNMDASISDLDSSRVKIVDPNFKLITKFMENSKLNSNLTHEVPVSSRMKLPPFGSRVRAQNMYVFHTSPHYVNKEKRGHSYFNNNKPISTDNKGYSPYNIYQSTNYPSNMDQSNSYSYGKPIYSNNFGNYNEPRPSSYADQYSYNNGNNQNNDYNPSYSNGGNNYKPISNYFGNYNGPRPSPYVGQNGYNNGNNQNNNYIPSYSNGGNNYKPISNNFGNYNGPRPLSYAGQYSYNNGNNQNNYNPQYSSGGNNYKEINKYYENKQDYSHSASNYGGQYNKYSINQEDNFKGNDLEYKYGRIIRQDTEPSSSLTDIINTFHQYTDNNGSSQDTNGDGNPDGISDMNNQGSDHQEYHHYSNNGNNHNQNNYYHKGIRYKNRPSSHGYGNKGDNHDNDYREPSYGNYKGEKDKIIHKDSTDDIIDIISGFNDHNSDERPMHHYKGHHGETIHHGNNNSNSGSHDEDNGDTFHHNYGQHHNDHEGSYNHGNHKGSGVKACNKCRPVYSGHHGENHGTTPQHNYKPASSEIIDSGHHYTHNHGNYQQGNHKGNVYHNNYHRPTQGELIDSISEYHYYTNKPLNINDNYGNKDKYENSHDCLHYKYIQSHNGQNDDDDGYNHLYHQIFHNRYGYPYWGRHFESHVDILKEIPICGDRIIESYKGSKPSKGDQNNYEGHKDDHYVAVHKGSHKEIYVPMPKGNSKGYNYQASHGNNGGYGSHKKGGNADNYFHLHHLQHPHSTYNKRQIAAFNVMLKEENRGLWPSELEKREGLPRTPNQNVYGYGALTKGHYNKNYKPVEQGPFSELVRHESNYKSNQPNSKVNAIPYVLHSSNVAKILSKFTEVIENEDRQKNMNSNIFEQDRFLSRKNNLEDGSLNQSNRISPNVPKNYSMELPNSKINVMKENKITALSPVDGTDDETQVNDERLYLSLDKLTNNDNTQQKVNISSTKPSRQSTPSIITTTNKEPESSAVRIKDIVIPYDKTYDYESGSYIKQVGKQE